MKFAFKATVMLAMTEDGWMPFGLRGDPDLTGIDFFGWGDPLLLEFEADDEETARNMALDLTFREANIGSEGWAARYREGRQRSLSVGDVVVLTLDDTTTTHQVLDFGFGEVDPASITDSGTWSTEECRARHKAAREAGLVR